MIALSIVSNIEDHETDGAEHSLFEVAYIECYRVFNH